ncbi:MAG: hypothetical protein CMH60_04890 [Myxococcales bacterium]|nr:hypothetical protein [Myxococcales bacterium]
MSKQYNNFEEFYPFYLSEHRNGVCRLCHFLGSLTVLAVFGYFLSQGNFADMWILLFLGYGPAWIGHFFFEKNRPATFKYPGYSFLGDWVMLKDILIGRIPLLGELEAKHLPAVATNES